MERKAVMNPMTVFVNNYNAHVDSAFHGFKHKHGKVYKHEKEEAQRKAIFHTNLR